MSRNASPPASLPLASTGRPFLYVGGRSRLRASSGETVAPGAGMRYQSRQRPIGAKFSSAKPGGAILLLEAAQEASLRCLSSCWRRVVAPVRSGSTAGTGGGGGTGVPSKLSRTHTPRVTGEVVVPFAVTLRRLACVITPPRTEPSGRATRRNCTPLTP